MFITFSTKSQALNFIKRNEKKYKCNYHEGCGCCFSYGNIFLDGTKVVTSNVTSYQGYLRADVTVIGKIKIRR